MQSAKRKPTEAVHQPAPGPDPAATRGGVVQELKVTGHLMTLDSGLFCIVNEANPQAAASGGLPGVRVSPPPMSGSAVEIIGFRPDGWLAAHGDAALVRVAEGGAQVLVTVYQAPGMAEAAPRLQVMRVGNGAAPAPHPVPKPEPMDMLAHIQTRGDVGAKFGAWLGEAGSGNWIEGIAVAAPEGIAAADLSYQAVLGRGWLSPWVEAGAYCGSRGMALPLLGVRVRLTGEAAETYDLTCEAGSLRRRRTSRISRRARRRAAAPEAGREIPFRPSEFPWAISAHRARSAGRGRTRDCLHDRAQPQPDRRGAQGDLCAAAGDPCGGSPFGARIRRGDAAGRIGL
jgi:hypothetical protein